MPARLPWMRSPSIPPAVTLLAAASAAAVTADAATWRRLVAEPVARGAGGAADQAWRVLSSVLTPLMWRNTKTVVAQEFHLPSRSLKPTWLRFQAGERAFYEQVGARWQRWTRSTRTCTCNEALRHPCCSPSLWQPGGC